MFDVSHMGEFIVKGKQAFDLVQRISSNDVAALANLKLEIPVQKKLCDAICAELEQDGSATFTVKLSEPLYE